MPAPTLTSLSPSSGPPGTAITATGAGFLSGARIALPAFIPTIYVSPTQLIAAVPSDLLAPGAPSLILSVFVENPDGLRSSALTFTVVFAPLAQAWTTVELVAAEVPGFKRGGRVEDKTIQNWIRSIAQSISGAMLRRALPLDPAQWPTPSPTTGLPAAIGVLELINRLGAAAPLAAAIASDFTSGEWGLAKSLEQRYQSERKALASGDYDCLFKVSAAVIETTPGLSTGDTADSPPAFTKDQVF